MVRTLHADLLAVQSSNISPYIRCIFTDRTGATTYDYSFNPTVTTNRLLSVEHHEEAYDDYATIVLNNQDHTIPALKGYYVDIGYGANTASGLKYESTARLWVREQDSVSMQGELKTVLQLDGVWRIMRKIPMRIGKPPYYKDDDTTSHLAGKTVYGIIQYVLDTLSVETSYQFHLNALGTQDDGIINTDIVEMGTVDDPAWGRPKPTFGDDDEVVPVSYAAYIAYLLTKGTKCYLRVDDGLYFTVRYPQSTDSVDKIYYSSLTYGHVFYDNMDADSQVIPNHIVVYGTNDAWASGEFTDANRIEGHAYNTDDFSSPPTYSGPFMEIRQLFQRGQVDNITRLEHIAQAHLAHVQAEAKGGHVLVPHDSAIELYDYVQIINFRGS